MPIDSDLGRFLDGRPSRITQDVVTAKVVRVEGGVHVIPLDDDTRHPIGPCRGPAGVAVNDVVLLIWTSGDYPWIAQVNAQPEP